MNLDIYFKNSVRPDDPLRNKMQYSRKIRTKSSYNSRKLHVLIYVQNTDKQLTQIARRFFTQKTCKIFIQIAWALNINAIWMKILNVFCVKNLHAICVSHLSVFCASITMYNFHSVFCANNTFYFSVGDVMQMLYYMIVILIMLKLRPIMSENQILCKI